MTHMTRHNFRLKKMDEVLNLSATLAEYYPSPLEYRTGIYELLINAIEHGNLEIGFDAKTQLIIAGKWREEVDQRSASFPYKSREIDIELVKYINECTLTIADQGKGFMWKNYLGQPYDNRRPNGRGLLIAYNSPFDHITFNAKGNQVTCTVRHPTKLLWRPN